MRGQGDLALAPARGGARKDSGHNLTPTEQKQALKALRERWERTHNAHMKRYGFERAAVIANKIGTAIQTHTVEDCIKIGNKWHYFNLLFHDKITREEIEKIFKELGYE